MSIKPRSRRPAVLALLGLAAVGPVLYPLWLELRTRRLSDPVPPDPVAWPPVTVLVPAYREQEVIAHKIENTFANGYPGETQVLVVADDTETSEAAERAGAQVVGQAGRVGKAGALNVGFGNASTPIVVLTDANAMLEQGALTRLVRWLDDPSIGAAAGEKRLLTETGESFYWRFESWLKRRESRTGSSIGVAGELVALRRELYRELPDDVSVDDLWIGLDVIEQQKRVVYARDAVSLEEASATLGHEWKRRTRIVCGTIDVIWRRRRLLLPSRSPVADQLIGHRLVRSSLGPLAHGALLVIAARSSGRSWIARGFVAVNAFGAVSLARQARGRTPGKLGRLGAQVVFLQAVGVAGTLRWLRGDRPSKWHKPERVFRPEVLEAAQEVRGPE
jgi:biofilm PGA synthesis N-glycosyltransferase PgaC